MSASGDTNVTGSRDDRGPVQTDEYWSTPLAEQPAYPTVSGQFGYTTATDAAPTWNATAAPIGTQEIQRSTKLTRNWDPTLGMLLNTAKVVTLSGSSLDVLRPGSGSSMELSRESYVYDSSPSGLNRLLSKSTQVGNITTKETYIHVAGLPLVQETTLTVVAPELSTPSFSGNLGKTYTYDATPYRWLLTETEKLTGRTLRYDERNAMGQVKRMTDLASGMVTTQDYDSWGRIIRKTREAKGAVGAVTTRFRYGNFGEFKEETTEGDGKTLTTRWEYDTFGRLTKTINLDSSFETRTYDGFGQLIAQSTWRVPGETDLYGTGKGYLTYSYDAKGRRTEIKNPKGQVIWSQPSEPAWGTATASNDGGKSATGMVTTVYNDRGAAKQEVLDLLGQRIAVIDEAGQMTRFAYDAYGNLKETDNDGLKRTYVYNPLGWLLSRTEPEEGQTLFSQFTALGTARLTERKGTAGTGTERIETELDAKHRVKRVVTKRNSVVQTDRSFTYREDFSVPTLLEETQTTGLLREGYGYDEIGRLTSKTVGDGLSSFTLTRSLDDLGNEKSLTYPAVGGRPSQVVTTGFDALQRPSTLALDGSNRASFTYNQTFGDQVQDVLNFGNGASTTSVRELGEVVRVSHAVKGGLANNRQDNYLGWSAGGLLLWRGPSSTNALNQNDTFTYDALDRLTSATTQGLDSTTRITQGFGYDRHGNRISSSWSNLAGALPGEVKPWTTAPSDWVKNRIPATVHTEAGDVPTYAVYDNLGQITDANAVPGDDTTRTQWSYDPAGRVATERVNGVLTSFLLDSEGLRLKRVGATKTTWTLYGFHREPLLVWESAAPQGAVVSTKTGLSANVRLKSSSQGGGDLSAPTARLNAVSSRAFRARAAARNRNAGSSASQLGSGATSKGTGIESQVIGGGTLACGAVISQPIGGTTLRVGQAVTFVGASAYGDMFSWSFGDGTTGSGSTLSHTFTTAGSYIVRLTTGDSLGEYSSSVASRSYTVTVAAPVITSFTATPSTITRGQSSTLAWSTAGATSLSLSGIGAVTGTSKVVTPTASTTYTLSATNAGGTTTASVTVGVSEPPPVIDSFTATATTLTQGQSLTLNWATRNATALSVSGVGAVSGTSLTVQPPIGTTTYVLTASSAVGSVTASLQVTVNALPPVIGSFTASRTSALQGDPITLSWSTLNATGFSISPTVGPVTGTSVVVVPPVGTTTYTLTATGPGGSNTASLQVQVQAAPAFTWKKTLVYGFGTLISEENGDGSGTVYVQGDQVGSPNVLTDAAGVVVGRAKNLPYGERYGQTGTKSARRFTNHEDQEGSAIYMQARTYLPAYGKFAQPDPAYDQKVYDKDSWNLYGYVSNNPVTRTDPTGQVAGNNSGWFDDERNENQKKTAAEKAKEEAKEEVAKKKPKEESRPEAQTSAQSHSSEGKPSGSPSAPQPPRQALPIKDSPLPAADGKPGLIPVNLSVGVGISYEIGNGKTTNQGQASVAATVTNSGHGLPNGASVQLTTRVPGSVKAYGLAASLGSNLAIGNGAGKTDMGGVAQNYAITVPGLQLVFTKSTSGVFQISGGLAMGLCFSTYETTTISKGVGSDRQHRINE